MSNSFNINKLYALSSEKDIFEFDLPLKDTITIDNKEYSIDIKHDKDNNLYIDFNGKSFPVEIVRSSQNKYEIVFNGISLNYNIETPFSLQRLKMLESKKISSDKCKLLAPMPGKIIDVMTKEGTYVARGETLVILEAMKMQNEILSPVAGIILSVICQVNSNVMKNDLLIEIKQQ